MTHVVVTGGSRGIGRGLALAFLRQGCRVTIAGRDLTAVERSVTELSAEVGLRLGEGHGSAAVSGCACNVTDYDAVQALIAFAERLAPIDIWVNNAGTNVPPAVLWEQNPALLHDLASTNLLGVMLGCHAQPCVMAARGHGKIYNVEGFGADGQKLVGFAAYGASKRAVRYLSQALAMEAKHTGVLVSTIDPGVVATELLREISTSTTPVLQRYIDVLAQPVEQVAPKLVHAMLRNRQSGVRLRAVGWLWVIGN